ncbi:flagellar biosynthesis protein FlhF [Oceanobacillus sp. Castelsardo]|uniref:flagellar biosynthesis protein FlhF n=1 Tax=Oceanobacillus sp. Castelsardo TaxID=1851204 RepID=UPI000839927E|nr:flagellar biosynthesis protein FlhF [Oceanobacillus sp. Castelsardo]
MKIKKYIAPNIAEAMKQIRKELGTDAVILNSREILQGGFLGFFKKKKIEVIVGLDPEPLSQQAIQVKKEKPSSIQQENTNNKRNSTNKDVLQEIQQLRKFVELQSKNQNVNSYPINYELFYQHLINQEVTPQLAKNLIDTMIEQHKDKNLTNNQILEELKRIITKSLQHYSFDGMNTGKKIIQFIGPTGVGKTTTLAKIASNLVLKEKKKVAFITMDTYRIAAVEQLKTYAQILHVPLEVAYTVEDYKNAINKFNSYDLILVDTAGRNFREEKYVKDLLKNLDANIEMETFLVLSLTAKPKDILEIYDQFQHIPMKEVIFTKLDETRQFGSLLNICMEKEVGIAYMTNGQDVPYDILEGNPYKIAELIVGEYNEE